MSSRACVIDSIYAHCRYVSGMKLKMLFDEYTTFGKLMHHGYEEHKRLLSNASSCTWKKHFCKTVFMLCFFEVNENLNLVAYFRGGD